MANLTLKVAVGGKVMIADNCVVTLQSIKAGRANITFDFPRDIPIHRKANREISKRVLKNHVPGIVTFQKGNHADTRPEQN